MLTLYLLNVFLVWIFSWRHLFQVTGTDASCVLYIICSPLNKSHFILPIAPGLLLCCYHLMAFCFALALISFWFNLIVQFTSEFSLCCIDLCKVSNEDSDHVISQMVVLMAQIEHNFFYIIFSILLVQCRYDLLNTSLQITGYVSLHNQSPLNITLRKLVFTSHCMYFYYIMTCLLSSAYVIGIVLFAQS